LEREKELIPHLFRTEYRKITSVLCKLFGIEYIEIAEDIVSDTFLLASETWGLSGFPKNPTAWLYLVAKNKAKNYLKRNALFVQTIIPEIKNTATKTQEIEIDFSTKNISDSQLQMMFAICHPSIPVDAQIGLSLRILCGFGIEEIADAFLTTKEITYKKLSRAKEKLRIEKTKIEVPSQREIDNRLETVLTTLYLLFNEGYYSLSQNTTLRKDLCLEAMRLNYLLVENEGTNKPSVNALLSLMCFHSSRFEARINKNGELVLYDEQDTNLWNEELIEKGRYYFKEAVKDNSISKYHIEAGIAYYHTNKTDTKEKWESILQLYNKLLQIEYSPITALNRTYALSKAEDKLTALKEAKGLNLKDNYLYYSLLGYLYTNVDNNEALKNLGISLKLSKTEADKIAISKNIKRLPK
jgi:RNA polymerase sigma factor (sigma-70 family)